MAVTNITLQLTAAASVSTKYPQTNHNMTSYAFGNLNDYADVKAYTFLRFSAIDPAYQYAKLINAYIYLIPSGYDDWISVCPFPNVLNLNTITYNTAPPFPEAVGIGGKDAYNSTYTRIPTRTNDGSVMTDAEFSAAAREILRAGTIGLAISPLDKGDGIYTVSYKGPASGDPVVLTVTLDPAVTIKSKVAIRAGQTSGYIDPRSARIFWWHFVPDGDYSCLADWTQTSATFQWREGTSGAWTSIQVSGSNTGITIPANTFPTGSTIQWRVTATDDVGTTSTTDTYTLSTAAEPIYASPTSPQNSIEENSGPILFRWAVSSADGQPQTYAHLQYSTNGSTWTRFASVNGGNTFYTAPAGTFPAGSILWRVAANNYDGVQGPWSSAASFVAFGAPAVPTVTVKAVNFPTVSWQAYSQEAYRVFIDGVQVAAGWGPLKVYISDEYYAPGEHTVAVQVQNAFGLWSPLSSVDFTVPTTLFSEPVFGRCTFGVDAQLVWTVPNASATKAVYVYRDGVKIANIADWHPSPEPNTYRDRFVLGTHSYRIIQRMNGDAGVASDAISGTLTAKCTQIAPLAGGEWQKLRLSDNSNRAEAFSFSRNVTLRHFSGADWPVAEIGPQTDGTGSFDVSFDDLEAAKVFEQLRGQVVIVKSRGQNVTVGVLSNLDKTVTKHYIRYTFTLQRIYWRDFIDLTQS